MHWSGRGPVIAPTVSLSLGFASSYLIFRINCRFLRQQVTQSELNEQEQRLQRLHQLGEDIIEESGNNDEITKEIKAQLLDFDECWNHVATRTLDEKEKVR